MATMDVSMKETQRLELNPPSFYNEMCEIQPPQEYKHLYYKAAHRYRALSDCELVRQGWQESRFNPNAKSPKGAEGIAQIVPATAKEHHVDPLNPEEAILFQAKYDLWCKDGWDHDLGGRTDLDLKALALACYNYGRGATYGNQRDYGWTLYIDAKPHLPAETRQYIEIILGV